MKTYKLTQIQVDLLKNLCLDCIQEMEKYTEVSELAKFARIESRTATQCMRALNRPIPKRKRSRGKQTKPKSNTMFNNRMEQEFIDKMWFNKIN